MRTSRTVTLNALSGGVPTYNAKRDKAGNLVVPLYSGFFSSLTDNVMCTNTMFDGLYREITSSVSLYPLKESILLNVYESSQTANDDVRESVLVGFRKYIMQFRQKAITGFRTHLVLFSLLFVIGVLMELLMYGVFPGVLPLWIENTLDIVAWVFVWQFAAYMAFEFAKEIKAIRRFNQILNIQFVFRHWE